MKRLLRLLPLLVIVPVLHLLVFYLAGRGVMDDGQALTLWAICFFGLTVAIGFVFGFACASHSNFLPYFACMAAIVAQLALTGILPSGQRAEVIGVAHRLKREFPVSEIRGCAGQLLQKYRSRTLIPADKEVPPADLWSGPLFIVDTNELPAMLRSRFCWVQVRKVQADFLDDLEVCFCIDLDHLIICHDRPEVRTDTLHPIQKGVYAYYHGRM